jgi:ribonuclease P protein component
LYPRGHCVCLTADLRERAASAGLEPAPVPFETLKKRAEFLRVKGGPRYSTAAFALEARARPETDLGAAAPKRTGVESDAARFGFTVSRKVGGAVVRNRIRRRLRALVAALDPALVRPGCDYVLIVRPAAVERSYAELKVDLEQALARVHRPQAKARKTRNPT